MKLKRNQKAFTLVELIVAIAIMGILLIIALPQVKNIQSANKEKKYKAYEKAIESAAKLYIDSYSKDEFGDNESGCITLKYSQLKAKNLIKDFSSKDITCSNDATTYVQVKKVKDEYFYASALACTEKNKNVYTKTIKNNFSCTKEPDKEAPTVIAIPDNSNWIQTKNLNVQVKISDDLGLNSNLGIIYYWKDLAGNKVTENYKYAYKNKKGVQTVQFQIPTNNIPTASGQYKLHIEPNVTKTTNGIQDMLGNESTREYVSGIYKIDNVKPSCGTASGAKTNWTNKDFTITVACSDDASGCTKSTYPRTYTTNTTTSTIEITDNAGNTNACPVNVYLDKIKPTISASFTKPNGSVYTSGSLTDTNVIRRLTVKDDFSGVSYTQYNTGGGWSTETKVASYTYSADVVNQTYRARTIDKAGNISKEISYVIKIEKNVDKNYKITCRTTCQGSCSLNGYNNDQIWEWNLGGAGSGVNRNTMGIDYSTDYVANYCLYNPGNAPYGSRRGCGYAVFGNTYIQYSRSFACSSIVGRACTNKNVCAQCVITDRSYC